jgi:TatD DNase family protein
MIIDSHCHFDFHAFDENREQVMQRARELGIGRIIVPGVSADSWHRVKQVCEQYPECYGAYGLHPYFIEQHSEHDVDLLERWLSREASVGVGECGLDFHLTELDRDKQLHFFEAQLALAERHDLPVIIHSRKATEQVMQMLRRFKNLRGMMHSYSGSYEQARQLMDMGFYLSFGGAITYDRATRLHSMIKKLPLEYLLIETDAPDQPDSLHQGQTNEPAYISSVIDRLQQLLDVDRDTIIDATSANARRLFAI